MEHDLTSADSGNSKVVIAYFWKVDRRSVPTAFLSMAFDRYFLRRLSNVHFAKLLGTGRGETFTPRDADLGRWGVIAVIDEDSIKKFDESRIIKKWRKHSLSEITLTLDPISSHGLWSKKNPFDWSITPADNLPVVAITRARIKWAQNFRFWRAVPPVTASLLSSPGLIRAIGIGEAPIGLQGTFSLWENAKAIRDFAYKGVEHQRAIAATKEFDWYSEELFSRFAVRNMRGSFE
jgi:hypothetical protein